MNIKAKQILIVGAFIVLTLVGYMLFPKDEVYINSDNSTEISGDARKIIYVHIEGAINFPGIKDVEEGTRLFELIELAGGTTDDADTSKINLASVLKDEQKIYIPYIENTNDDSNVSTTQNSNGTASKTDNINAIKSFTLVNINSANVQELETLDGIGPSMANKIIEYRETNGYFSSIEDIKNVSGIGEAKFNKIKDNISI